MRSIRPLWLILASIITLNIIFAAIGVFAQEATPTPTPTETESEENQIDQALLDEKNKQIEELQNKLNELSTQKATLANQIAYVNSQISLTELKISQTESQIIFLQNQIDVLGKKISNLDLSLDHLTAAFISRAVSDYKLKRASPLTYVVTADNFSDILNTSKYFSVMQKRDRQMMIQLEEARLNYDLQKQDKDQKQQELAVLGKQLEAQKIALSSQKRDKEYILQITKNDEKHYQNLLDQARAELQAIQGIISGMGQESEVGQVGEGEKIATIISGASACSTGTHLHFEVRQNGVPQDPANYLSSNSIVWDNQPDGPFSFNGSWSWPINGSPRITQGYGYTFYAVQLRYYGGSPHSGIDIVSDDLVVKAVKPGNLYNGSIKCGGGSLRYVRVDHQDSDISTYYLHVNYAKV